MTKKSKNTKTAPAAKAAVLREQIENLRQAPSAGAPPVTAKPKPMSPREFIQRQMESITKRRQR